MSGLGQQLADAISSLGVVQREKQQKKRPISQIRNVNIYPPLTTEEDIRLVHLLPGAFHDDLDLALVTYDASEAPAYEALSYVWGDASIQKAALVNGEVFSIGMNLDAALRHLRTKEEEDGDKSTRTLWVDALCIDQQNVPERNQQVNRMRDIYAGAEHTVIWMGGESDGSEQVLEAVEVMSRYVDLQENYLRTAVIAEPPGEDGHVVANEKLQRYGSTS